MNVKFVKAKKEDLHVAHEIYNYYVKNSTSTFHIDEVSLDTMNSILFSKDPLYESYMIKTSSENIIVGYVLLTSYRPREAFKRTAEVTIYLSPDFTKENIGNISLSFIEGIAKEKNIKTLVALICGENKGSIALFEKHNYYRCGYIKNVAEKFNKILDLAIYEKEI